MDVLVTKLNDEKASTTFDILQSIAKHISSREDCRHKEYTIVIETDDLNGYANIKMTDPEDIWVYKSRYHRKIWDKRPLLQHVILEHFRNVFGLHANGNNVNLKPQYVVKGTYKYKFNGSKYRRWFKVD